VSLPDSAISIEGLTVGFGAKTVIDGLSLDVRRREILGLIGASGGGKSVLLRAVLGLIPKRAGRIEILGRVRAAGSAREIGRRCGTLFQQGALFSSLTVLENLEFPMREYLGGSDGLRREVALAKLEMVGLSADDAMKFPAELSGGMVKRAALARALALDPDVLLLDEPTSGLDPIAAGDFDALIKALHQTLGLTVFMVTHDLDTLHSLCDRVAALYAGKIVAIGPLAEVREFDHPWIKAYFRGARGRAALA
jgi:phospholipid/cholesterol/gamma-HCH transport system ATP-binding protein